MDIMLANAKLWVVDVLIKKLGPSALRGALLALTTFLIAHANILGSYGVIYDAATGTITLNLGKLSMALILGLPALIAAILKLTSHSASEVVLSTPSTTPPSA
jgi:hypothetical protein